MTWLMTLLGNWRPIVLAGGLALILGFGGGYKLRSLLDDHSEVGRLAAEAEAQKQAQAEADAKSAAWETQLASLRAANKQLIRRLQDETKDPVYARCIVPDSGVQIFNDALSGSHPSR